MAEKRRPVDAARVTLGLIDGHSIEGCVRAFVPQAPDLHLYPTESRWIARPHTFLATQKR